jgi:hypothetical protein
MRNRLLLLNLALVALIAGAIWQLRVRWLEAREHESVLLRRSLPALPVPAVLVPPVAGSVSSAPYLEVASRLLLSRDRNPNVVIEETPPPPMPAFPRFYGVMGFDDKPFIILAERQGAPQQKYQVGQTVGEFKIVQLQSSGLTLEWDGKEVFAGFAEMVDRAPVLQSQSPEPSQPAPQAAQPSASVTAVSTPVSAKPGLEMTPTMKACLPGDSSPAGTVSEGFRKIVTPTPFGNSCRWEQVR